MVTALTEPQRRQLERQLGEQLRQDCDEARRLGYKPTVFLGMLSKDGPKKACLQVIMSVKIPDGFLRLLEIERSDPSTNALRLTAEATILRGPWREIFEVEVLNQARKRLISYNRGDLAAS